MQSSRYSGLLPGAVLAPEECEFQRVQLSERKNLPAIRVIQQWNDERGVGMKHFQQVLKEKKSFLHEKELR